MKNRISKQFLSKVDVVYFHSGCPDGITAREVLRNCLPLVDFRPYDFGRAFTEDELSELTQHTTLFIDCHPNLDQLLPMMDRLQLAVADHHESSQLALEALILPYPDRIMIGSTPDGESGAMLARELCYDLGCKISPELNSQVDLVAIGDTWQKNHPMFRLARDLAGYLLFYGNERSGPANMSEVKLMATINQKRDQARADHAVIRTISNLKVAFIPTTSTSDVAELLRERGVDLTIGHKVVCLDGVDTIKYSIRSNDKFYARTLAEAIGGGGHPLAAGASMRYRGKDPIAEITAKIQRLHGEWLRSFLTLL